jgi:hypothetical protein
MSAGTFSLNPSPPSVGVDPANFAGALTVGPVTGTTPVATLSLDVAARVKQAPIQLIQQAYLRSTRDFCRRTEYLRRTIPPTALTPNSGTYNFGSDPVLEVVDIKAAAVQQLPPSNNWVNLRTTPQDTYDPNQAADIPIWYSYIPDGMVQFYPPPNLAYNVKLELIVQPLLVATAVPNDLIAKFWFYLEAGAMWHLYLMDKEPWFNPTLAAKAESDFNEGIGMGKSWVDRGFQRGSVRATPRPFISR